MKNKHLGILLFCYLAVTSMFAQTIQSPSEFLGYELGTRFSRHHQVMDYYQYIASMLPKQVKLVHYGKTYEQRPLIAVYISSESNMDQLDEIQRAHRLNREGKTNSSDKAIVWLSYNVHGNESVSTEASMQTLYELLTEKQNWLENTVVIIDPCMNPDGRDRYVNWYNQKANSPFNVDPNSLEHQEPWPGGRANHYLFDLNRDWAWVTQIESKQRLNLFNQWLPHIHVDFHEQGVDAPYYFAPAAEPLHEVITPFQREFQTTIGKNHARYFDANGWFYFTKEIFDLLYPSYGDTYPTYNGAIGMTYEQGGSGRAGLGIITRYGDTLTLKDRISHHHTTGLSTVEVASLNTQNLIKEYKNFYTQRKFEHKSYVLRGNPDKLAALQKLLDAHQIQYGFATGTSVKGMDYNSLSVRNMQTTDQDLVINTNQVKGTIIKVLFEQKTKLSDSLTYDITAWSLPYAYGLEAIASQTEVPSLQRAPLSISTIKSEDSYAYLGDWNSLQDARFLAELLQNNIRVRYTEKPFQINQKTFTQGSLIVTRGDNRNFNNFDQTLIQIANSHNKELTAVTTGMVDVGKDFGSESVKMVPKITVALLAEGTTSSLSMGETWHFFEQQLNYPVTVLNEQTINKVDLSNYDVLVVPELYGNYFVGDSLKKLNNWIQEGGKLIVIGNAISYFTGNDYAIRKVESTDISEDDTAKKTPFQNSEREYIKNMITGAIFKAKVDNSNPLAFGYDDSYFTLKLGSEGYQLLKSGNAVYLEDNEPFAGFAGSEAKKQLKNTLIFGNQSYGNGQIIYMVDNPLFRGFGKMASCFC